MARPMPRVPPVTIAVLPARLNNDISDELDNVQTPIYAQEAMALACNIFRLIGPFRRCSGQWPAIVHDVVMVKAVADEH